MFKKIHRRLTLTNVLILTSFLLVFSYTLIGFFSSALNRTAENTLYNKATELITISQQRNSFDYIMLDNMLLSKDNNAQGYSNIYYVTWNDNRKLSSLNFVDNQIIEELFKESKVIFNNKSGIYKDTEFDEEEYKVYTQYYELANGRGGVVQVFKSTELDNYILRQLFFVILSIGLVGIIILIAISSYMARKSLKPIKTSYDKQKEFVADASHELRTPLTIMKTNLELLSMKDDELIRDNRQWLDNISDETETMTKLVQNLLVLAQVDNNEIKLKIDTVNLSFIVERAVDKFELLAKEKDIQLNGITADDVLVRGDENRLEQLIVILIDNAIKYTPEKGKVLVSLMTTSDKAYLTVKDNGVGINDDDKEKIFNRFYRTDKVRSREQGGVGLGLSIAKWIVDEHKATIEVISKLGEGSEFIVCFDTKNFKI